MGQAKNVIRDRIKVDPERRKREGIGISDEEFEALVKEINGRTTTHGDGGWERASSEASLYGVPLLDMNGDRRRWPKASGPYPCPKCRGTGFEDWNVDGSRFCGAADCSMCNGTGNLSAIEEPTPSLPGRSEGRAITLTTNSDKARKFFKSAHDVANAIANDPNRDSTCPECFGTGWHGGDSLSPCSLCKGTGRT